MVWISRKAAAEARLQWLPKPMTVGERKAMRINTELVQDGGEDPLLDAIPSFDAGKGLDLEKGEKPVKEKPKSTKAKQEIPTNVAKESKAPMDKGKIDDGKKEK